MLNTFEETFEVTEINTSHFLLLGRGGGEGEGSLFVVLYGSSKA